MNNTPEQIARFEHFRKGWRRKSALTLDDVGVPPKQVWHHCSGLTQAEHDELFDWYCDVPEPGSERKLTFSDDMEDAGLLLATGRIVINPVWRCVAE